MKDWEEQLDEEFGGVIYSSGSFEQEFLKDFITKLLKEQREEIVEIFIKKIKE